MLEARDRLIVAQTAYKCAAWLHAAEVQGGAEPDTEHLFALARSVANGMIKLSGSPSAGQAGGSNQPPSPRTEEEPRGAAPYSSPPSVPSCPKCNEPMEFNQKSVGTNKPAWRCSQRGRFILESKSWTGCDGVRWEAAA